MCHRHDFQSFLLSNPHSRRQQIKISQRRTFPFELTRNWLAIIGRSQIQTCNEALVGYLLKTAVWLDRKWLRKNQSQRGARRPNSSALLHSLGGRYSSHAPGPIVRFAGSFSDAMKQIAFVTVAWPLSPLVTVAYFTINKTELNRKQNCH